MNTLEIASAEDQDCGALTYTWPVRGMPSVEAAEELARRLLEPLGSRWAHTQAVAARADGLTPAVLPMDDRPLLVVAAWWHDLGYAPALQATGCHQIDGARYLAQRGLPGAPGRPRRASLRCHMRGGGARSPGRAGGVAA